MNALVCYSPRGRAARAPASRASVPMRSTLTSHQRPRLDQRADASTCLPAGAEPEVRPVNGAGVALTGKGMRATAPALPGYVGRLAHKASRAATAPATLWRRVPPMSSRAARRPTCTRRLRRRPDAKGPAGGDRLVADANRSAALAAATARRARRPRLRQRRRTPPLRRRLPHRRRAPVADERPRALAVRGDDTTDPTQRRVRDARSAPPPRRLRSRARGAPRRRRDVRRKPAVHRRQQGGGLRIEYGPADATARRSSSPSSSATAASSRPTSRLATPTSTPCRRRRARGTGRADPVGRHARRAERRRLRLAPQHEPRHRPHRRA